MSISSLFHLSLTWWCSIEQSRTFAELSYLMFNMTIEHDPDQYNLIPNDHDLDWI